jgi:hypothetical protein
MDHFEQPGKTHSTLNPVLWENQKLKKEQSLERYYKKKGEK